MKNKLVQEYLYALSTKKPLNQQTGQINMQRLMELQNSDIPKLCEIIERLYDIAYFAVPEIESDYDQEKMSEELVKIDLLIEESDLVRCTNDLLN